MTLTATSQTTELACGTRDATAACVEMLRDVVAGLDADALLAQEAPEVWALFDQGEKLCSAAKVLVSRRVEDSGVWKDVGMRSAAEYLALRGGTTREAARDALKTSERVANLPQVEDALRRGELSGPQAHVIADAASHDPTAQPGLLDQAKVGSFKELRDECLRRKAAADPKPQDTRDRIHKDRYVRLSTDAEGAWRLSGRGPLDHAGTFAATLNPLIDDQFKQARAEGRREERGALAFDALQEMVRLARAMYYGDDLPDYETDDTSEDTDDAGERPDAWAGQTSTGTRGREDRPGTKDSYQHTGIGAEHPDAAANHAENTTRPGAGQGVGDTAGAPSSATEETAGSDTADGVQTLLPGHSDQGGGTTGHRRRQRGSNRKTRKKQRKRTNPSHLAILRLDVEALRHGYTQGDELCEIAGLGPVPVDAARVLLGDSILKLVLTKGTAVANVHEGWALVSGTGKRPMVSPGDPRHPATAARKEDHRRLAQAA